MVEFREIEHEYEKPSDRVVIVPFSDLHVGNKAADKKRIRRTVEWIGEYADYWFGGGDYCDAIVPSPNERRFDFDSLDRELATPDEQYRWVYDVLEPIKHKCVGLLTGNHDDVIRQRHSHNHVMELCDRLGVPYLGYSALLRWRFCRGVHRTKLDLYAHHGKSAARTKGGKINKARTMDRIFDADVYCFTPDAEILTPTGWKNYTEISDGDLVLNYNVESGKIEPDVILQKVVRFHSGELYHIKNRHVDVFVTSEHRILYRNRPYIKSNGKQVKTNWLFKEAKDFVQMKNQREIFVAGNKDSEGTGESLDFLRLCGWIISEGHFKNERSAHKAIMIFQRESNSQKIKKLLEKLELKFSVYRRKDKGYTTKQGYTTKEDTIVFYIHAEDGKRLREKISSKRVPSWLFEVNYKEFYAFLDVLMDGDGYWHNYMQSGLYFTKDEVLADQLQRLFILNGWRCKKKKRKRTFVLLITKRKTTEISQGSIIEKQLYSGVVWDVVTANTTVIVRQNGCPIITGNCMSHVHDINPDVRPFLVFDSQGNIVEMRKYYVLTGGFLRGYVKGLSTYVERGMYAPTILGSMFVEVRPEKDVFPWIKVDEVTI